MSIALYISYRQPDHYRSIGKRFAPIFLFPLEKECFGCRRICVVMPWSDRSLALSQHGRSEKVPL